jgi:hypothetical protein
MKILKLIIAISCCTFSHSFSQTRGRPLNLNEQMLILEHRIWLSSNRDTCNALLFQKAGILKQASQFERSRRELNRIESNDKINNELLYEKAIVSFLSGDFSDSYNQLSDISDSIRFNTKSICFLWLLTLSELHQWGKCKNALIRKDSLLSTETKVLAGLPTILSYKSPEKAYRLSSYLPGLGQAYSGHWGRGVTSFIINAGLIWFAYQQYAATFYITATCAGVYPLSRFYNGGRNLSYNLTLEYNETLEGKTMQQYQEVIRKLFE